MRWTPERIAAGEGASARPAGSQVAVTLSSNSWVVAGWKMMVGGRPPGGWSMELFHVTGTLSSRTPWPGIV